MYSGQKIPSSANYRIFEDSRGYIWIASKNGLYKFDGFTFQPYYSNYDDSTTLTSNSISDIEEDAKGFLWIATGSNGVVRMDPYTGKMKQYPSLSTSTNPVYPVWDIYKDADNVLWFGTGGRGIARYNPQTDRFTNYIVDPKSDSSGSVRFDNEIKEITSDPLDKNILWAAGMRGLFRFNKTTGRSEKFEFNNKNNDAEWRDNSFHCIYIEDLQHIWLGTWAGGLVKFDYSTKTFSHFMIDDEAYQKYDLSKNIILDLLPAPGQQLYICSADAGFIGFDKSTGKFSELIDAKKLPNTGLFTHSAFTSKNGSLWIAAEGFILLYHPLFNRFGQTLDLSSLAKKGFNAPNFTDAVYDKIKRKYYVALGGYDALLELNEDLTVSNKIPCSIADPIRYIKNIFFDKKGRLFAASSAPPYLMYLDDKKKMLLPVAGNLIGKNIFPESMRIKSTKFDGKNTIWIAYNDNQLIKWDIENNTTSKFTLAVSKQSGLPANVFVIEMAIDSLQHVWLATNAGLFKFTDKDEKFTHYYAKGRSSENIASNYLNAVAVDRQNRIWIAPQFQGVQVFNPLSGKVTHNYSAGHGGISNHIDAIAIDNQNNLWFTSNTGLLQFESSSNTWKVFNTGDGLSQTNLTGFLSFTQNEKILLGIGSEVIRFDPYQVQENKNKPVMHITGFDVSGKNYLTDSLPDYKKNISLTYNQNWVDISVTAIETLYPEKIKIYYRLKGLDTNWHYSETRHISFVSLAPGSYTFEAKAVNSDGFESEQPAVISFSINKPFWKTIWFIALCVLAFVSLVYVLYRYRIRQILRVQEIKNKISADLHDDIGSRLTNIQLLTQISKNRSAHDAQAVKQLDNIQEEVSASSEALHEIVTNMRIKDDDAEELAVRLRRYAVQVFELSKVDLKMNIDDEISNLKLHPEKRNDLFLIYKELLNNTGKHAEAKNAEILVQKIKKNILLSIADDGKGFNTAAPTARNGLKIIKGRVEKWKGKTKITSSAESGTSIVITIPV